jgi:hypothetical protein
MALSERVARSSRTSSPKSNAGSTYFANSGEPSSEKFFERNEHAQLALIYSVFSIPLALRLGTAPTGILFTTVMVLRSTTTVTSSPAAAT